MSVENSTYRQIEEQHQNGSQATVLVERSGNQISTGTYKGESSRKPGYYTVSVDGGAGERDVPATNLTDGYQAELAEQLAGMTTVQSIGRNAVKGLELSAPLTPANEVNPNFIRGADLRRLREQIAASDAAGNATPASGAMRHEGISQSIGDQLKQLAQGLSPEDIQRLEWYASYKQDQAVAQKEGKGQDSTAAGQGAGQEYLKMSPKAQSLASRYANLWIKLNPID